MPRPPQPLRPPRRRAAAAAGTLAALLGLAGLVHPAAAQTEPAPAEPTDGAPPEVFFERLEVHVVNVDVYVTDRDGNPVTGLTKDDFELYEDGRRVPITNFYAVAGGRPQTQAPGALGEAAPGETAPGPPAAPLDAARVPEDQRLHLVVFVDNLHIAPFGRNRVMRELQAVLGGMLGPDDRAMLVAFDRTLEVRQEFTSDPRLIARGLDGLEKLTGFAVQRARERTDVLGALERAPDAISAQGDVDFYAKSAHDDLRRTVAALKQLVGSLGGVPGRKALLYVSDGIPMTPGEDLFYLLERRFANNLTTSSIQAARYRMQREFRELTAQASSSRVTFYTLDARGLQSHSSLSAEHGGSPDASYLEADILNDSNLAAPLQLMAEETGGLAAFNTNNVRGALERMARDFDTYYSLGYTPAHHGDGRYYPIEVRVPGRRGLVVRHRDGYRDKTLETRVTDATLGALLYGGTENRLGVRVDVGAGERGRGRRHYLVPIEVRIPLGSVTFLPRPGVHEARLRVAIAAGDGEGEMSIPQQVEVPIVVPEAELETARTQSFVYEAKLMMLPGVHQLAVGVRDDVSGDASYLRRSVAVGR